MSDAKKTHAEFDKCAELKKMCENEGQIMQSRVAAVEAVLSPNAKDLEALIERIKAGQKAPASESRVAVGSDGVGLKKRLGQAPPSKSYDNYRCLAFFESSLEMQHSLESKAEIDEALGNLKIHREAVAELCNSARAARNNGICCESSQEAHGESWCAEEGGQVLCGGCEVEGQTCYIKHRAGCSVRQRSGTWARHQELYCD